MLQKKYKNASNKFIVSDEKSFQFFIKNEIKDMTLNIFDDSEIEKKLPFYLKAVEYLSKTEEVKVEITTNSPLILITIPMLKKIKGLEVIELTAVRGKKPEEIIKAAKAIRDQKLPVKVKYIR